MCGAVPPSATAPLLGRPLESSTRCASRGRFESALENVLHILLVRALSGLVGTPFSSFVDDRKLPHIYEPATYSSPPPPCVLRATQDIDCPALKTSKSLWWGRTWHMQTPLETLGSSSTMVFELRDLQVGGGGVPGNIFARSVQVCRNSNKRLFFSLSFKIIH